VVTSGGGEGGASSASVGSTHFSQVDMSTSPHAGCPPWVHGDIGVLIMCCACVFDARADLVDVLQVYVHTNISISIYLSSYLSIYPSIYIYTYIVYISIFICIYIHILYIIYIIHVYILYIYI